MSIRNLTLHKKQDFSTSTSETSENVYLFVSRFMIGFLWSLYLYTLFLLMYKYLLELIQRRSKVREKNMSCESTLNFDQ